MLQLLCQSDSYNAININKQNMQRADTEWEVLQISCVCLTFKINVVYGESPYNVYKNIYDVVLIHLTCVLSEQSCIPNNIT